MSSCASLHSRGAGLDFDNPSAVHGSPRGYAILEAKSMKEALELTKRFLRIHGDEWDIECEVRQLDGPECGART